MRICTIYNCGSAGDRRCCMDCDKIPCQHRCLNHPDRCRCAAYEEKRKQGEKKGSLDPQKILALAKQGLEYKEIAGRIGCQLGTVQYHLAKLGYKRRRGGPDG